MSQQPPQKPQQPYQVPPGQVPHGQMAPGQMPPKKSGTSTWLIVGIVLGVGALLMACSCPIVIALTLPAVQAAREAARSTTSANQMKMIGLGMQNYHDTFKKLPRAAMPDSDGNPRHSWRVAILPFVEAGPLHDRVDYSRAWDEPPNSALNDQPPMFMHSPRDPSAKSDTSYVAIVGSNAAFDPTRQLSLRDIADGTSNTIAVIEIDNSGVNWMEPRDITIEEAITYIKSAPLPVNALMMDGSVQRISPDVPPDNLRAMMTRNGGDRIY